MKIAIYPGSFNPWHEGHEDIMHKALQIFDQINVVKMRNPDKNHTPGDIPGLSNKLIRFIEANNYKDRIYIGSSDRLLVDSVKNYDAVIRGLRNGHDLQYETNLQYWNEDLGLKIPIVYFITDRTLSHISSSAIRQLEVFNELKRG